MLWNMVSIDLYHAINKGRNIVFDKVIKLVATSFLHGMANTSCLRKSHCFF